MIAGRGLVAILGIFALVALVKANISTQQTFVLESNASYVSIAWPTITVYAKWTNQTVFTDEYFLVTFTDSTS